MSLTASVVPFSHILATTFFKKHISLKNQEWGITYVFYAIEWNMLVLTAYFRHLPIDFGMMHGASDAFFMQYFFFIIIMISNPSLWRFHFHTILVKETHPFFNFMQDNELSRLSSPDGLSSSGRWIPTSTRGVPSCCRRLPPSTWDVPPAGRWIPSPTWCLPVTARCLSRPARCLSRPARTVCSSTLRWGKVKPGNWTHLNVIWIDDFHMCSVDNAFPCIILNVVCVWNVELWSFYGHFSHKVSGQTNFV